MSVFKIPQVMTFKLGFGTQNCPKIALLYFVNNGGEGRCKDLDLSTNALSMQCLAISRDPGRTVLHC